MLHRINCIEEQNCIKFNKYSVKSLNLKGESIKRNWYSEKAKTEEHVCPSSFRNKSQEYIQSSRKLNRG